MINELLDADFELVSLFVTEETIFEKHIPYTLITEAELKKISALTTANDCLAVFKIK